MKNETEITLEDLRTAIFMQNYIKSCGIDNIAAEVYTLLKLESSLSFPCLIDYFRTANSLSHWEMGL